MDVALSFNEFELPNLIKELGGKVWCPFYEIRVIVSTSFNDNHRIYSIIKNINPDGFLIKSDISSKEIVTAINEVINGAPYFSRTVSEHLLVIAYNRFITSQSSEVTEIEDERRINRIYSLYGIKESDVSEVLEEISERIK